MERNHIYFSLHNKNHIQHFDYYKFFRVNFYEKNQQLLLRVTYLNII